MGLRNQEQTAPGEARGRFWRTRVRFPPPPPRGVRDPSSRHAAGRQQAARRSRAGRGAPIARRTASRDRQMAQPPEAELHHPLVGPLGTARAGSNRSASRCASLSPRCTVDLSRRTRRRGRGLCPVFPRRRVTLADEPCTRSRRQAAASAAGLRTATAGLWTRYCQLAIPSVSMKFRQGDGVATRRSAC